MLLTIPPFNDQRSGTSCLVKMDCSTWKFVLELVVESPSVLERKLTRAFRIPSSPSDSRCTTTSGWSPTRRRMGRLAIERSAQRQSSSASAELRWCGTIWMASNRVFIVRFISRLAPGCTLTRSRMVGKKLVAVTRTV